MADFALWATACEKALFPPGTFWAAYSGNRDEAVADVIEADPLATAVRSLMAQRAEWAGTASDLLGALAGLPAAREARSKAWPDSPRALAGRLRRAATFLRKTGMEISFEREGHAYTHYPDHQGHQNHPGFTVRIDGIVLSASDAQRAEGLWGTSFADDCPAGGRKRGGPNQSSAQKARNLNAAARADDADANLRARPGPPMCDRKPSLTERQTRKLSNRKVVKHYLLL
jgi:hypothetical protein